MPNIFGFDEEEEDDDDDRIRKKVYLFLLRSTVIDYFLVSGIQV